MANGQVYILLNAAMPGMLKIGMTSRTPEERAREISQATGVAVPYSVAYAEAVPDCAAAEALIHSRLANYRLHQGREFFHIPLRDAIRELSEIAKEVRGSAQVGTNAPPDSDSPTRDFDRPEDIVPVTLGLTAATDVEQQSSKGNRERYEPTYCGNRSFGKYGEIALRAIALVRDGVCTSAEQSWQIAAREMFPGSPDSQRKGCPKSAFLGLCQEGLVLGIPVGRYTESRDNKMYAIKAVQLLHKDPQLAYSGANALWHKVMNGERKRPNYQMHVVLALWEAKLIVQERVEYLTSDMTNS